MRAQSAGISLLLIVAVSAVVVSALGQTGIIRFTPFTAGEFAQLITPLFLVALFVERAVEVFVSGWRNIKKTELKDDKTQATKPWRLRRRAPEIWTPHGRPSGITTRRWPSTRPKHASGRSQPASCWASSSLRWVCERWGCSWTRVNSRILGKASVLDSMSWTCC